MLIQHRVLDLHFYRGGDSGQTSCICLCIKRGKTKDNKISIEGWCCNIVIQGRLTIFLPRLLKWIHNQVEYKISPTAQQRELILLNKERKGVACCFLFKTFQENDEMISFPYSRLKANILIRVRCISRGDHHHHHPQGKITRNVSGWEW